MSEEIHGYEKMHFDYEHFDPSTRKTAEALRPKSLNNSTGEVDWKKEIKRYVVSWPKNPEAEAGLRGSARVTARLAKATQRVRTLNGELAKAESVVDGLESDLKD